MTNYNKSNTTASERKENCQRALPEIGMSGTFSSVDSVYKHKSSVCPVQALRLIKPMHHTQTERARHTLQTSHCWTNMKLIQDSVAQHHNALMQSDN